jgi:putative FmdB family regulatory protein
MPIYAYKCESCGHAKDVLQKISDAPLTVCPQCGAPAFKKQVTAAGFQLKGSGWYVTDFRGGNSTGGAPAPKTDSGETGAAKGADSKPADSGTAAPASAAAAPASAPAAPAKAPAGDSSSKSSS